MVRIEETRCFQQQPAVTCGPLDRVGAAGWTCRRAVQGICPACRSRSKSLSTRRLIADEDLRSVPVRRQVWRSRLQDRVRGTAAAKAPTRMRWRAHERLRWRATVRHCRTPRLAPRHDSVHVDRFGRRGESRSARLCATRCSRAPVIQRGRLWSEQKMAGASRARITARPCVRGARRRRQSLTREEGNRFGRRRSCVAVSTEWRPTLAGSTGNEAACSSEGWRRLGAIARASSNRSKPSGGTQAAGGFQRAKRSKV